MASVESPRPAGRRARGVTPEDAAAAMAELFPAIYLRLHRLRPKGGLRPDGQMLALLGHLALAGPLTVGEAARHADRAQSVMSELVDRLVRRGLAARVPDGRDRRRVLVWLTPVGEEALREEREVLSRPRLSRALARMAPADRAALLRGTRALVEAARRAGADEVEEARRRA